MTSSFTDYADFAAQCDAANAYADAQQVIARTPITLAAPVSAEERSMLLGVNCDWVRLALKSLTSLMSSLLIMLNL